MTWALPALLALVGGAGATAGLFWLLRRAQERIHELEMAAMEARLASVAARATDLEKVASQLREGSDEVTRWGLQQALDLLDPASARLVTDGMRTRRMHPDSGQAGGGTGDKDPSDVPTVPIIVGPLP